MVDTYQDFVYTRLSSGCSNSATTLSVEDTSLFPTNTILAKSNFWLTLESALTYPNTFEVCLLTAVNTGTNVLTVTRGQAQTSGVAHDPLTSVKGSLTSDMLRRIRSGFAGTSVPAQDNDLYVIGDRFFKTDIGVEYIYTSTGFVVPSPGARLTATATTSSLAPQATDTSHTIALGQGYRLYSIETSRPARVELYSTAAQMTADAARSIGSDPDGAAGVVLDFVAVAGSTVYSLSPLVDGSNLESSPSKNISMRVTNMDSSTGTVVVTLVYVATE